MIATFGWGYRDAVEEPRFMLLSLLLGGPAGRRNVGVWKWRCILISRSLEPCVLLFVTCLQYWVWGCWEVPVRPCSSGACRAQLREKLSRARYDIQRLTGVETVGFTGSRAVQGRWRRARIGIAVVGRFCSGKLRRGPCMYGFGVRILFL